MADFDGKSVLVTGGSRCIGRACCTVLARAGARVEALQLAQEVDDCRHGKSYPEFGALRSAEREAACVGLAQTVADVRSNGGLRPFDPGVVNLAQMPEMIHSRMTTLVSAMPRYCMLWCSGAR